MAQVFKIIIFLMVLSAISAGYARADGAYITAYGKAKRQFMAKVYEAEMSGKSLTMAERKKLHEELFVDAKKAYIKESTQMLKSLRKMGREVMREIRDMKKPPESMSAQEAERLAKLDDQSFENELSKDKNDDKVAATPSKRAAEPSAPASTKEEPARKPASSAVDRAAASPGNVESGTAEKVTFTKPSSSAPASKTPQQGPAESGSAENVSFTSPSAAAKGTSFTTGTKAESGSAEHISFTSSAPTPPAAAPAGKK